MKGKEKKKVKNAKTQYEVVKEIQKCKNTNKLNKKSSKKLC